jgi:ABC-type nitrate/sulfonate/bicarbonate transport system substrate-binding protein
MRYAARIVLAALMVACWGLFGTAHAAELRTLKVNIAFLPHNLALFAAIDEGFLARRGLAAELLRTTSSQQQRDGLANGTFDIVHTAVDNAVAMVNTGKGDVIIVMGGDNGMNELYVRPEIKSYEDLRGKTVVVDAPNTAYAFQLYKMLELKGMKKGDYVVQSVGAGAQRVKAMLENPNYVAGMLSPHSSFLVGQQGFHSLGTAVDVTGPYQGMGGFVMRSWARANSDVLVKYIEANIEGLRWASSPANRAKAVALLVKYLRVTPDIAASSMEAAVGERGGMDKDAAFDLEAFRGTLKLRAEIEGRPSDVPAPDKYIDLSYYKRAHDGFGP